MVGLGLLLLLGLADRLLRLVEGLGVFKVSFVTDFKRKTVECDGEHELETDAKK